MKFIDGSSQKVPPFEYILKRNIAYRCMNINNDIVTILLAYNNNITTGDRVCFSYVNLYQSKYNQQEESAQFHTICLTFTKQIQKQNTISMQQTNESMEQTQTD